jgi:methylenetetrahydrofolate reductase (NADPH)
MNPFRSQSLESRSLESQQTPAADVRVSIECFPPKTDDAAITLWDSMVRFHAVDPAFVSVTYGAGGTDQERSFATLDRLLAGTQFAPAAHLTCVGATKAETDAVVDRLWDMGVRHVIALRGDMPGGAGAPYHPTPGGYANAAELVAGIRNRYADIEITVSAYPERHPESVSDSADLDMLQAKVDAGATNAITQFFFDNDRYLSYVEAVRARDIEVPIIPGIMPVRDLRQVAGFAGRCGTTIPAWFADRFAGLDDDPETRRIVGVSLAAEQIRDLIDHDVTSFHFYSMNRSDMVVATCRLLGIGAASPPLCSGDVAAA